MKRILRGYHSQIDPDTKSVPTHPPFLSQETIQQRNNQFICVEESRKQPHLPHDSIHFQN